jgi:hypothetical protein
MGSFWLKFGETEKIGMSNFGGALAWVAGSIAAVSVSGLIEVEKTNTMLSLAGIIIGSLSTFLIGSTGGKSGNLGKPQTEFNLADPNLHQTIKNIAEEEAIKSVNNALRAGGEISQFTNSQGNDNIDK